MVGLCIIGTATLTTGCSAPRKSESATQGSAATVITAVPEEGEQELAEFPFKTVAEAQAKLNALGPSPAPLEFATGISEIDGWLVARDEEEAFQAYKLSQLERLRRIVATTITAHQDAALRAASSPDSAREFSEAQGLLVLYPISDDKRVIAEAQQLSKRQAEVSRRLEGLRRQRYNRWAIDQLEHALNYFNDKKSVSVFRNRNIALIKPLVKILGPVDPALLEPVVSDLYVDVLTKRIKESLSDGHWRDFAKQLTGPSIVRKVLGEI
jgi:hypothetical protein